MIENKIQKIIGNLIWKSVWVKLECDYHILVEDSIWDTVAIFVRSVQGPTVNSIHNSITKINENF